MTVDANRLRGKRSQRRGRAAEDLVALRLRWLGLLEVAEIATPKRVLAGKTIAVGLQTIRTAGRTVHTKKVAGDFYAVLPGGRGVLVECKSMRDRLSWHDLLDHQVLRLDAYAAAGGLSLLAWVSTAGCAIMRWRPIGFDGPRCALTPDAAMAQALRPGFWIARGPGVA